MSFGRVKSIPTVSGNDPQRAVGWKPKAREPLDMPICFVVIDLSEARRGSEELSTEVGRTRNTKIFISQNGASPPGHFRDFKTHQTICYEPLCDDFGPMNMLCIIQFIECIENEILVCCESGIDHLVYRADSGPRAFTNAAFLLGAYMILKLKQTPDEVKKRFGGINPKFFEGYRDASFSVPDFRLRLIDCWQGLDRGKSLGWVELPRDPSSSEWGLIDKGAYAHYCNPLNADLHEVVPQKFVAFRGPKDLGGPVYINNYEKQTREFDPEYYLEIFEELGVSTVTRLNEVTYSADTFRDKGIEHYDLYFDDCTPPPPEVVRRFFRIVDRATGVVAVHCKAGLGRTGTLIALYMMRNYGFSAREVMGWLRIMRPGCIAGEQQHYLCAIDTQIAGRVLSAVTEAAHSPSPAEGADDSALPRGLSWQGGRMAEAPRRASSGASNLVSLSPPVLAQVVPDPRRRRGVAVRAATGANQVDTEDVPLPTPAREAPNPAALGGAWRRRALMTGTHHTVSLRDLRQLVAR